MTISEENNVLNIFDEPQIYSCYLLLFLKSSEITYLASQTYQSNSWRATSGISPNEQPRDTQKAFGTLIVLIVNIRILRVLNHGKW